MKRFLYGAVLSAIVCTEACKVPASTNASQPGIILPTAYPGTNDTGITTPPSWKTFFTDAKLSALIDTAMLYNQDLQSAQQRIMMAQAELQAAKGTLLPVISGGLTSGLRKFGLYTMDGAGNSTTEITPGKIVPVVLPDYFVGIQTSWEADLWGKLKSRKQAAAARVMAGWEGKHLLATQIVSAVASGYYELKATAEALRIVDENIVLQERALGLVRIQKEAAASNELAVQQFESQLLFLRSFRLELVQQATQIENAIHLVTGKLPQAVQKDTAFFSAVLPSLISTGVPSSLLQFRPDIRQAEWNLVAGKAELKSARAAFYPSLNITGSLGFQAFRPDLLVRTPESIAYGLIGGLTAPLVNRAAIKANFSRADAVQLEAYYQYQKSILNGYVEVHNEMLRSKTLGEAFSLKRKETEVLTTSVDVAETLFRAGRASYLEVLLTRQQALQARLALVELRKKQLLTTIGLYKAVGGGWQ
jgi:NodT family efflux transporter outer membrane factor (OMF) lipoprotein